MYGLRHPCIDALGDWAWRLKVYQYRHLAALYPYDGIYQVLGIIRLTMPSGE